MEHPTNDKAARKRARNGTADPAEHPIAETPPTDDRQLTVEEIAARAASTDEPPVRVHVPEESDLPAVKSGATADEQQPAMTRAEKWSELLSLWNEADGDVLAAQARRSHAETEIARFAGKGQIVRLPNGEDRKTKFYRDGSPPGLDAPPKPLATFDPTKG